MASRVRQEQKKHRKGLLKSLTQINELMKPYVRVMKVIHKQARVRKKMGLPPLVRRSV